MMNFQGRAARLAQGDIGDAAKELGVETAVLLAFTEVEAAGKGFDTQGRPKMLFEPHVFYRELGNTSARAVAVQLGLAYAKWLPGKYPSDSYPRLMRAIEINETAALRSASYGLGQILGSNHLACGHTTVQDMVSAAMASERAQLFQMVTLMRAWGMVPMLTGKDFTRPDSWRQAASKWNGAGYATHNYHGRMAAAYAKHLKVGYLPPALPTAVVLGAGMKGEAVRNWQTDLQAYGFKFAYGIDGRFGPETVKHTRAFQLSKGLTVDGRVGPDTLAAMKKVRDPAMPETPMEFDRSTTNPIIAILRLIADLLGRA